MSTPAWNRIGDCESKVDGVGLRSAWPALSIEAMFSRFDSGMPWIVAVALCREHAILFQCDPSVGAC